MNHRSRIAFSTPSTPTFIFGQQSTRLGIYFNDFNVTALILWRRFFGHHFICFFLCYRSFCTVACFGFKMFYNFKKLPSWRLPATLQFNITLCKIFFLSLLFISMFILLGYKKTSQHENCLMKIGSFIWMKNTMCLKKRSKKKKLH